MIWIDKAIGGTHDLCTACEKATTQQPVYVLEITGDVTEQGVKASLCSKCFEGLSVSAALIGRGVAVVG